MPHWDFYCVMCETTYDLSFPSFDTASRALCPTCKGPLTRQWSAPLVKFEGAGFHCNDYPEIRVKEYGAKQ